ncbi:universal stress protein family [Staphylococcus piscifermentans]|uniref:Universal stress protein n=1 Tax=Staphylococcus piscifermentans TaxID=70258 RepID=A0A239TLE3_9STAP|nr:universal stress protein [Staphylococcus piscifermentans]RTX86168.1 universal stress protein [Staphylococcus piscifermentans]GEP85783.1 universal stress protein [Staphylococcus piscifermentans]SNU98550.1 universal stress protein family [Staphylococcus piscifermentans]
MYKNILVPFDFGNAFNNVPEQLKKLTNGAEDAKITIFNVISETDLANYVRYQNKHFEEVTKEKEEDMQPFVKKLEELNLPYEIVFTVGSPTTEILTDLESNKYDIVVMSNKRSRVELKHVLGHVTHKVAKRSNTPVLIVK